jgi:oligopeptide/dipeptide ABC transporter ATP-binding protein
VTLHPGSILEVDGLTTRIALRDTGITPVNRVSVSVGRGETLCIVGESGSGKSMLALSIMRVLPPGARIVEGRVVLEGQDLARLPDDAMRRIRGHRISMILQDPMTAFDPLLSIGAQIVEAIQAHERIPEGRARERVLELLAQVRLPDPARVARAIPSQLSGGMNQRALIAMALATDPIVLIADEPTTALDVTIQAQVLELLRELQTSRGLAVMLITHDMGVAAMVGKRIAVMYAGRVVESGPIDTIFRRPRHPYSLGLIEAAQDEGEGGAGHISIPGAPPDLRALSSGCAFAPRCAYARAECSAAVPAFRNPEAEVLVACVLDDAERPWLQPVPGVIHG